MRSNFICLLVTQHVKYLIGVNTLWWEHTVYSDFSRALPSMHSVIYLLHVLPALFLSLSHSTSFPSSFSLAPRRWSTQTRWWNLGHHLECLRRPVSFPFLFILSNTRCPELSVSVERACHFLPFWFNFLFNRLWFPVSWPRPIPSAWLVWGTVCSHRWSVLSLTLGGR